MLDPRQFQALRAVHEAGSVTGAARALGWSQPTVDYHLRNLGRLLGGAALERSPRGSHLTAAGRLLLERGDEILTLSERALTDAQLVLRRGRPPVRFGTFPTAAVLLPSIVARVADTDVELEVMLKENPELLSDLHRGELDVVLAYSVPTVRLPVRPGFSAVEVHREPMLVALPAEHSLAAADALSLDALRSLHDEAWMLGASERDPMDALLLATFDEAGLRPEVAIRTDDSQVMLAMVAAGLAVCLMPQLAARGAHPGVALVPIADDDFARTLHLVVPTARKREHLPFTLPQLERLLAAAISDSSAN